MKAMYSMCLAFVFALLAGCVPSEEKTIEPQFSLTPGRQHPKTSEGGQGKTRYLLYLPEGYGEKQRSWPMILFLHGLGESGDDLERVKDEGLPRVVEDKKDFPFIVVSPQCPRGKWWSNDVLIVLLADVTSRYAVDQQQIYLTGLSMGGFGTWSLACAYPKHFAAIAPICGGGKPHIAKGRLKSVPVWAFHGAKDKAVPLERSEEMVEAVKAGGGDAKLTVYPNAGHDSWTETYDNPKLYEWFLKHRRN